jgi:hypothetical protein
VRVHDRAVLARIEVPGGAGGDAAPRGVLVRLDTPLAAFVHPVAWRWLRGEAVTERELPAASRAACEQAWIAAGLTAPADSAADRAAGRAPDPADHGVTGLTAPVVAVGVAPSCGFCAQLAADVSANADTLADAGFGLVLADTAGAASAGGFRGFGRVPREAAGSLAGLARAAAAAGTPGGIVVGPDLEARRVTGYDQVAGVLTELSGWDGHVVLEPPSSCSVNVAAAGDLDCVPMRAAGPGLTAAPVVGVGLRGAVRRELAGFAAARSAGRGFTPVTLTIERIGNLYLVYRGGELIGRLRTSAHVRGLVDTVLAGFAPAQASGPAGSGWVPVLAGAACRDDQAVLFPRGWLSGLVKQQTRLARVAGWRICPDPYVHLAATRDGIRALVHPEPAEEPSAPWPAREVRVPDVVAEAGAAPQRGPLLAQVVNWIARPATAGQVHTLAAIASALSPQADSGEHMLSRLLGGD